MGLDGGDDALKEDLYAKLLGDAPIRGNAAPQMSSYSPVIESETADFSVSVRRATEISI